MTIVRTAPNGIISEGQFVVQGSYSFLEAILAPDDGMSVVCSYTATQTTTLVPSVEIPAGSSVASVSIVFRGRLIHEPPRTTRNLTSIIRVGGSDFTATSTLGDAGTIYSENPEWDEYRFTWETNPVDGLPWTSETVSTIQRINPRVLVGTGGSTTAAFELDHAYLEVDYEEPTPSPDPPTITQHPESVTVESGETATFEAGADSYDSTQWQVQVGSEWSDIEGESSELYTTPVLDSTYNGYSYRAVFSNFAGSSTTNAALLTVAEPIPEGSTYTIEISDTISISDINNDQIIEVVYEDIFHDSVNINESLEVTYVEGTPPMRIFLGGLAITYVYYGDLRIIKFEAN